MYRHGLMQPNSAFKKWPNSVQIHFCFIVWQCPLATSEKRDWSGRGEGLLRPSLKAVCHKWESSSSGTKLWMGQIWGYLNIEQKMAINCNSAGWIVKENWGLGLTSLIHNPLIHSFQLRMHSLMQRTFMEHLVGKRQGRNRRQESCLYLVCA